MIEFSWKLWRPVETVICRPTRKNIAVSAFRLYITFLVGDGSNAEEDVKEDIQVVGERPRKRLAGTRGLSNKANAEDLLTSSVYKLYDSLSDFYARQKVKQDKIINDVKEQLANQTALINRRIMF